VIEKNFESRKKWRVKAIFGENTKSLRGYLKSIVKLMKFNYFGTGGLRHMVAAVKSYLQNYN
jgi:hypothetical protein